VSATVRAAINRGMFEHEYAHAFDGDKNWQGLAIPTGGIYHWDDSSTYIKKPPYFDNMVDPNTPLQDFHLKRAGAFAEFRTRISVDSRKEVIVIFP
jgi:aconitate hydratase